MESENIFILIKTAYFQINISSIMNWDWERKFSGVPHHAEEKLYERLYTIVCRKLNVETRSEVPNAMLEKRSLLSGGTFSGSYFVEIGRIRRP